MAWDKSCLVSWILSRKEWVCYDSFPCVKIVYEPGSKLLVLGMVIQPLIGNPYNGYVNPYYWVDDHPLLYGNNGSLDPSTYNIIHPGSLTASLPLKNDGWKTSLSFWVQVPFQGLLLLNFGGVYQTYFCIYPQPGCWLVTTRITFLGSGIPN